MIVLISLPDVSFGAARSRRQIRLELASHCPKIIHFKYRLLVPEEMLHPIADRVAPWQHLENISQTFPTNQKSAHGIYDKYQVINDESHENPGTPGTELKVFRNNIKILCRPFYNWLYTWMCPFVCVSCLRETRLRIALHVSIMHTHTLSYTLHFKSRLLVPEDMRLRVGIVLPAHVLIHLESRLRVLVPENVWLNIAKKVVYGVATISRSLKL